MTSITHKLLFLIAAIVCFTIALLIVTGVVVSDTARDWEIGGLLALALSLVP